MAKETSDSESITEDNLSLVSEKQQSPKQEKQWVSARPTAWQVRPKNQIINQGLADKQEAEPEQTVPSQSEQKDVKVEEKQIEAKKLEEAIPERPKKEAPESQVNPLNPNSRSPTQQSDPKEKKSDISTPKLDQEDKNTKSQGHETAEQKTKGGGVGKKMGASMFKNLLGTAGLAAIALVVGGGFPIGVALAAAVVAGGLAKTGYDLYQINETRKDQKNTFAPSNPNDQSRKPVKEKSLEQEKSIIKDPKKIEEKKAVTFDQDNIAKLNAEAEIHKANQKVTEKANQPQPNSSPAPKEESKTKGPEHTKEPEKTEVKSPTNQAKNKSDTQAFVDRFKTSNKVNSADNSKTSGPPSTPINQKINAEDKSKGGRSK